MRSFLRLPNELRYSSTSWHKSTRFPSVRFSVRRPSLGQRIELTAKARELLGAHEFLKAGDATDQLSASLSEQLVRRLYVEWGLAALEGLTIDGQPANPVLLIERGPEELTEEIADAVIRESSLSEAERKNS